MSTLMAREMKEIAEQMAAIPEVDTFTQDQVLPQEFFDLLEQFYKKFDDYAEYNIEASELDVTCQEACSNCCYQSLWGLYSFETVNLYRIMYEWGDYAQVHNALARDAQEFQKIVTSLVPENTQVMSDSPELEQARMKYKDLGRPCAFLQDDRCRVYDARPTICRMYHSIGDPSLCSTVQGMTVHLEPPKEADKILLDVSDRMEFEFSKVLPHGLVWFGNKIMQYKPLSQ